MEACFMTVFLVGPSTWNNTCSHETPFSGCPQENKVRMNEIPLVLNDGLSVTRDSPEEAA